MILDIYDCTSYTFSCELHSLGRYTFAEFFRCLIDKLTPQLRHFRRNKDGMKPRRFWSCCKGVFQRQKFTESMVFHLKPSIPW